MEEGQPRAALLFCSGNALGTISPRVLDQPNRALLSKPFSEVALLLKVQGLLEGNRLSRSDGPRATPT